MSEANRILKQISEGSYDLDSFPDHDTRFCDVVDCQICVNGEIPESPAQSGQPCPQCRQPMNPTRVENYDGEYEEGWSCRNCETSFSNNELG